MEADRLRSHFVTNAAGAYHPGGLSYDPVSLPPLSATREIRSSD
jgi:hypothetical protein